MLVLLYLFLLLCAARAQDASSYANYFSSSLLNIFQLDELVNIENGIVQQLCNGATGQQVFDNLGPIVVHRIGDQTNAALMTLRSQLINDLGNEAFADGGATRAAIAQVLVPMLEDIAQYCGAGGEAVFAEANNYANQQFAQQFYDQLYQSITAVNPNDWPIYRNDFSSCMFFSNYGY
ncbi:hypothetical protein QR680_015747 [Steinernema hermaphroditum]|uniref:Uncharacterized protein n=1 Tax=Steinernema hermaphroditum TaxID=289476 RepID=A0AA39LL44_9BILA|nr:hypothetical protein QR680_015747 [Steinernema hermaphroditum]